MAYQERYCAFVDILGFRSFIQDLDAGRLSSADMDGLFETMHKSILVGLPIIEEEDLRLSAISDAICLSSTVTGGGLRRVMQCLIDLTLFLLARGYFVRGGLVRGNLEHNNNAVYGSALVRAFDIESKTARYPRIMITRDVYLDAIREHVQRGGIADLAQRAVDGPMFLHPLAKVEHFMEAAKTDEKMIGQVSGIFNPLAEQIQRRLDEAVDEPSRFEKVQWFARYWNRSTDKYREHILAIEGPV